VYLLLLLYIQIRTLHFLNQIIFNNYRCSDSSWFFFFGCYKFNNAV